MARARCFEGHDLGVDEDDPYADPDCMICFHKMLEGQLRMEEDEEHLAEQAILEKEAEANEEAYWEGMEDKARR